MSSVFYCPIEKRCSENVPGDFIILYRIIVQNNNAPGAGKQVSENSTSQEGCVYLVGAGPGDPGLMTVRGFELLGRADVVLYDFLVNPLVLEPVRADAETICLGRHGEGRLMSQQEINQKMIDFVRAGKIVVRLKGGDPAVFARLAEEVDALDAAGIVWEIVPGITASLAAPSYAGIPVTHRDHASAVAMITGQERDANGGKKLDYSALAAFPGPLIFYMGVTTAADWTQALIDAGRDRETPATIIRRCSWTDQQVICCRLDSVADELARRRMRPPAVIVIGQTDGTTPAASWFARKPLIGQTIMVTRPRKESYAMCRRLSELGAGCLVQPAIEIVPPQDWSPVDAALERIDDYDWLVFSSANGVQALLDRLCLAHGDLRRLGGLHLATIGPSTTEALKAYHLSVDVQPTEYRAEALAEALATDAADRRFLLARASRGREILAEKLSAAGGKVDQVVVYESRDVKTAAAEIVKAIADRHIDWITVTSSAIARSLVSLFGQKLHGVRLASISPITSEVLRECGYEPAIEAVDYTSAGLIAAIKASVSDTQEGR
jgi:uroporphyrinogen III methyltransferase/synthase